MKGQQHIVDLLWADDDCEDLLSPLSWKFKLEGFRLKTGSTYKEAMEILENNHIDSLLVDIILPYATGTGTLGSNLGLELAETAARKGVKSIVFLTVVLQSELGEKYPQIISSYPQVKFDYSDKLLLLEPNHIEAIIEKLRNSSS